MSDSIKKDAGIVSCCLADGKKKVFATSTRNGKNWKHAERNAYEQFCKQFGSPSPEAIFVVTLSPCLANLKYRKEPSCSELMRRVGVTRTHFGIIDDIQASSIKDYEKLGITASYTTNLYLSRVCERLMSLFSTYDARINSDLLGIKKELGNDFFKV